MPWARIPSDRLDTISAFGYNLEKTDGKFLWYRGPDGELYCVNKYAPRFLFESAGDAVQAGCTAIRLSGDKEIAEAEAAFKAASETEPPDESDDAHC